MSVTVQPFGTTRDGEDVVLIRLTNSSGAYVEVISYGAAVRAVAVPDKEGRLTDVCLGYDDMAGYEAGDAYLGALVGRCANRIRGAEFSLGGKQYHLTENQPGCSLHGGGKGFDKWVWDYRIEGERVLFSRTSPDGEEHYPGNLWVTVGYGWTDRNELILDLLAESDADTVVNLTSHAYWNLDGHGAGDVGGHTLQIDAGGYTEKGPEACPTGTIAAVEGTPFDLRQAKPLAERWGEDHPQLVPGGGYDHNWALDGEGLRRVAELASPASGIRMTLSTDQPGLQVYTSNGMGEHKGKAGALYGYRRAVALEAQGFPDAVHHAGFPTAVLRAGEEYRRKIIFAFSV